MFGGNRQTIIEAWDVIIKNLVEIRRKYPELNGLKYWETIKIFLEEIDARNSTKITYNLEHINIVKKFEKFLYHLPEKDEEGNLIQKNHFLLQQLNLPYKDKGKVSFRRFMQIALNIGQFEYFNNTDHFSPEIIELIKENKLSDINSYMTPENYNKFIFEDADLIKLEDIINKLNKNPPLEQVGGNKYRSYKITYNNMYGGAALAPGGSVSFPTIDVFRTKYEKTASYLYTRDPGTGTYYFVLARKVPLGSRRRLDPKGRTGAAGTQDRYCGKWGSFGGAADKKSKHTLDAAIIEIADEGGIRGLTTKTIDIKWSRNRNAGALFTLELATEINSVAILLFRVDFARFQQLFPIFPDKRGGATIVTSSHGEIDYVSSFTIQQLIDLQTDENKRNRNNFMLSYAVDTFNKVVFPHIANESRAFSKRGLLPYVRDEVFRKVIPPPTYTEGPSGKYT
jgi:hypothetical protein